MKIKFLFILAGLIFLCSCSKQKPGSNINQNFEIKHDILNQNIKRFLLSNNDINKIIIGYTKEVDFSKGTPSTTTINRPLIRVFLTNEGQNNLKMFLKTTWYKNGSESFKGLSFYTNNKKLITTYAYSGLGNKNYIDFTFFKKNQTYNKKLIKSFTDSRVSTKE